MNPKTKLYNRIFITFLATAASSIASVTVLYSPLGNGIKAGTILTLGYVLGMLANWVRRGNRRQTSQHESLCLKCQSAHATRGIGPTKTLCSKCWNNMVTNLQNH